MSHNGLKYKIEEIPFNVLIDSTGKIIYRDVKPRNVSKIQNYINTRGYSVRVNNIDIGSYSYINFQCYITKITTTTMDGTFTGKSIGINSATGASITDTIANGSFTNVPITRYFR